jgi:thiaminase
VLQEGDVDVFAVHEDSLALATKNYVGFLLDTASRADASAAEILAAMTPCARLYAFLGEKIREAQEAIQVNGADDLKPNPYQRWIDSYASSGFQEAADTMEMLLDELASIDNAEVEVLSARYHRAMELELAFFEEFFPFRESRDHTSTLSLRSMLSSSSTVVLLDRCTSSTLSTSSACSSVGEGIYSAFWC